jgi:hypothetical protein
LPLINHLCKEKQEDYLFATIFRASFSPLVLRVFQQLVAHYRKYQSLTLPAILIQSQMMKMKGCFGFSSSLISFLASLLYHLESQPG